MASRRVRIKGIANIPQRRKPSNSGVEEQNVNAVNTNEVQETIPLIKSDEIVDIAKTEHVDPPSVCEEESKPEEIAKDTKPAISRRRFIKPIVSRSVIDKQAIKKEQNTIEEKLIPDVTNNTQTENDLDESTENVVVNPSVNLLNSNSEKDDNEKLIENIECDLKSGVIYANSDVKDEKPVISRRRVIKPVVSRNVINKQTVRKEYVNEEKLIPDVASNTQTANDSQKATNNLFNPLIDDEQLIENVKSDLTNGVNTNSDEKDKKTVISRRRLIKSVVSRNVINEQTVRKEQVKEENLPDATTDIQDVRDSQEDTGNTFFKPSVDEEKLVEDIVYDLTNKVTKPTISRRRFITPIVSQIIINKQTIRRESENEEKLIRDVSSNIEEVNDSQVASEKPFVTPLNHDEKLVQNVETNLISGFNSNEKDVKPAISRRRFIKPVVSRNVINKQIVRKEYVNEEKLIPDVINNIDDLNDSQEISQKTFVKPSVNLLNNRVKKDDNDRQVENVECNLTGQSNVNLEETSLPVFNKGENFVENAVNLNNEPLGISKLPKPQYIDLSKCGSDSDHPPPAPSPNKFLNRARIKAVPRLGQRRTSFNIGSASESEDDSKKTHNRIRNDSICSVTSGTFETQTFVENPQQRKEFSSVIQRKCRRTEQSRKLAEARKDFYMKYNDGKPDRQRLTMLDLLFYNPSTSPMSQKKRRRLDTDSSIISNKTAVEEENVDDPDDPKQLEDKEAVSDEENTVPAPQITIGANGEIIVDEKSLVIENKETKKNREALKQSEIVDGDFDTGYGVYKRVKRSRDWSKEETLRFYKALNTIGTDFTMMCELFPDRNRKELKMKFKKEERMNRSLIDRAVMQPIQFDLTELRNEVEMAEIEKLEAERCRKEKEQYKHDCATKRKSRKSVPRDLKIRKTVLKEKKSNSHEILKSGINSICDSDSDESVMTITSNITKSEMTDSEDESVTLGKIHTTRSGRISKPNIILTDDDETPYNEIREENQPAENTMSERNINHKEKNNVLTDDVTPNDEVMKEYIPAKINSVNNDVEDEEMLAPGSVIIMTETDENGETIHKIYTIDIDGNKVPINLTPEVVENLTSEIKGGVDHMESGNEEESNVCDIETIENESVTSKSVDDVTSLNVADVIGNDSMIIPFDEYEEHLLNATDVSLLNDQTIEV